MIQKACPRRHLHPQSLCHESIGADTSVSASRQRTSAQESENSGLERARPIELILSELPDVRFPDSIAAFVIVAIILRLFLTRVAL